MPDRRCLVTQIMDRTSGSPRCSAELGSGPGLRTSMYLVPSIYGNYDDDDEIEEEGEEEEEEH